MKTKIFFLVALFLSFLIITPVSADAIDGWCDTMDIQACCPQQANGQDCTILGDKYYLFNGECMILSDATEPTDAKRELGKYTTNNQEFNCLTGEVRCPDGYISCSTGICVKPIESEEITCSKAGKAYDACITSGSKCTNCLFGGASDDCLTPGGIDTALGALTTLVGTINTRLGAAEGFITDIQEILGLIFNQDTLVQINDNFLKDSYYFLQPTTPEDAVGDIHYNYMDGGDHVVLKVDEAREVIVPAGTEKGKVLKVNADGKSYWDFGGVGMFKNLSTGDASNGKVGGYAAANDECLDNKHVCSAQEIINTYENDSTKMDGLEETVWINNGPPGYEANVNDCYGWNWDSTDSSTYGYVWSFKVNTGFIAKCSRSYHFACCQ